MNAARRLTRARARLVLDAPFFGSLALRLSLVEDRRAETAWTDGQVLGFNPGYIDGLGTGQVQALVAHEVMHLACLHHTRRKDREPGRWNVAADYAINAILVEAGFRLPAGALLDPRYANRSAEAIYDRLPVSLDDNQHPEPVACGFGQVRDEPIPSGGSLEPVEARWKVAMAQAVQQARAMGNLPHGLERLVKEIVEPTVDWRELLRHWIEVAARSDYSWLPPGRRWLSSGVCLPGLHARTLGQVVVAIDTSGSVDDSLLARFAAELSGLLEDYDTRVRVLFCDTRVQAVQTVERQDLPLVLTPIGGGGTDFRPVFEWVEKQGLTPCCLVYLTDLECHRYPQAVPDYPVLWLCTQPTQCRVPFGQVVRMD